MFGTVNVVDALVVLVVFASAIAGVALVSSSDATATGSQAATQMSVDVGTIVPSYVLNASRNGSATRDVESIEEIAVIKVLESDATSSDWPPKTGPDTYYRLRLTARLNADVDENGLPYFREYRLYVGTKLRLDLGTTVVEGTVMRVRLA